ncbi:MAG: electron transfer flavoprotein subunit alpha/FixB family protein [Armatimonadetes bacterium]|nr:electron transfer flavoprotein subunit alpha/FixB family protein [Armatimonadota bacterium]
MAKALLIVFDASEAGACAGFASALGMEFDVLGFEGEMPPADAFADGLTQQCEGYTHIAAVSSMRSKDVLARLAGLLDAAMITDAVAVETPTVFVRPMVAGAVLAKVEVLAEPVVITFRPAGFPTADVPSMKTVSIAPGATVKVSESSGGGSRPDLTQAKVVVSGGRPLKDAETFERIIGGLADKLGGAVGATRAAVDSGIAANELQVGQTGKIVAPDLYIAAGISGSTQHMAGIKDSKVIVAINTDPDAPIFESADFGLVADLFDAVPELTEKV